MVKNDQDAFVKVLTWLVTKKKKTVIEAIVISN